LARYAEPFFESPEVHLSDPENYHITVATAPIDTSNAVLEQLRAIGRNPYNYIY